MSVQNLDDYGVSTWRQEGNVVYWSFVGHDVGKPLEPDEYRIQVTFSAE